jgi:cysteine desulfuration protein SufE
MTERANLDSDATSTPPARLDRLLDRFERLGREQTMALLVELADQFPELPPRFAEVARDDRYKVHECMTPVSLFSELRDGRIYFYADVPREAPTVRALLTIFTQALNGEPPEAVLAIPSDYVSRLMRKVGLMTRERGLNAMVARMKRHAVEALAA